MGHAACGCPRGLEQSPAGNSINLGRTTPSAAQKVGLHRATDEDEEDEKDLVKLSPVANRFMDAVIEIRQNPDAFELAFMARQLVQCTLPHSDPGDVPLWTRRNGKASLSLQPGVRDGELMGLPYGSIPRLVLFWLVTEVVQNEKRRIELGETEEQRRIIQLGKSLSGFMRELGLSTNTGRGKRGGARAVREQTERLFGCRITLDETGLVRSDGARGERHSSMEVTTDRELWWDPKNPEQFALFGSWVRLGEKLFRALLAFPVPVDMRALKALKKSPLELDLYAWLTHSMFNLMESRTVPWKGLHDQMGGDYAEMRDFKANVKKALKKIRLVYPALRVEAAKDGLVLHPSPPAIPPTKRRPRPKTIVMHKKAVD